MGMTNYLGIKDVSKQLGVKYYRIRYAHEMGLIPEPMIVGGKRLYSEDDVRRVREYFKVPSETNKTKVQE